jgi:hypothetical protein
MCSSSTQSVGRHKLHNPRAKLTLTSNEGFAGLISLALTTLYSFSLPFRGSICPLDSAVLIGLFVLYAILVPRHPSKGRTCSGRSHRRAPLRDTPPERAYHVRVRHR